MAIQIQYRRGTAEDWYTANPTLAIGEPGYETDTGRFKVGNGSQNWNSLSYSSGLLGPGYSGVTSDSTLTFGSGSTYVFVTPSALNGIGTGSYKTGDRVRVLKATDTTSYIEGLITTSASATSAASGSITVTAETYSGSGSNSSWIFSLASGPNGKGYYGVSSTTSNTIGASSSYIFSIPNSSNGIGTGAYKAGDSVRVLSSASPTSNYIDGTITSVTESTPTVAGSITVSASRYSGSGTIASWNFSLVGTPGLGYSGVTSTTSTIAIGTPTTGTYTFSIPVLVGTGAYKVGDEVRVSSSATATNYIDGTITSLTAVSGSTPGTIIVTPKRTNGSGTPAGWNFSLVGAPSFGYSNVTSTTSVTIGSPNNGSAYTFVISTTVGTGAYQNGQRVRVNSASATTNYIEGTITAFTAISGSTSGSITVTPETTGGTGTISDPVFSLSGGSGFVGITSTSNVTIPTSTFTSGTTYTFVVNTPGALAVGTRVRAYSSASVSRYLEGPISSITASTGSVVIAADTFGGVGGSITSWTLAVAGGNGYTGVTGTNSATAPNALVSFGLGSKSFAVSGTGAYQVGQRVRVFQTSSATDYMEGIITAIAGSSTTNPQITVNVDTTSGSTSWTSVAFTFALAANITTTAVEFVIDGGGDVIISGTKGFIEIPFSGSVTQWTLMADQTGSISVDLAKKAYTSNSLPSTSASAEVITPASTDVKITSGTTGQGVPSSWRNNGTIVTAGDIIAFTIPSNATSITRVTLSLKFSRAS